MLMDACSWTHALLLRTITTPNPHPCPHHTTHAPIQNKCAASTWKGQLGLRKQGKEGSITLARHLLPTAAGQLQ